MSTRHIQLQTKLLCTVGELQMRTIKKLKIVVFDAIKSNEIYTFMRKNRYLNDTLHFISHLGLTIGSQFMFKRINRNET